MTNAQAWGLDKAWPTTRGTPLSRLAAVVGLQLMIGAAYITYFTYSFDFGERLIVLHLCVMATVLTVGSLTMGLALRNVRPRIARPLIAVVSAGGFAILTVLYAANLVSTRAWGHNITVDLAARYISRPRVVASYLATVTSWPVIVLVGGFVIAGALYLLRSGIVAEGLAHLFGKPPNSRMGRSAIVAALVVTGAVPALAGIAVAYTIPAAPRYELLLREPLIGFFMDSASVHRFALSTFAARFRTEGPAVRSHYAGGQSFERRNVVVIVADSLRADHLQLYGYDRETSPFLNRLSATGKLKQVRLAMATCPDSVCGISSILASKSFGSLVPENFALHELLFDQGYDVNFILSGDHQWFGLRKFYGDDLTLYFDGTSSRQYVPTDDRLLFEGLEQVPSFTGKPAFFYFHVMSSHVLGYRQDRHLRFHPSTNPGSLSEQINRYDNGVVQADAIIEELFSALDQKGYLESAMVVILADHGEGLGEHFGASGHAFSGSLYQEFLRIPLLIYDESAGNYANLDFATHVDIAPTIVSRLGLQVPSSWEGRPLLDPGVREFSHHYMDTYDVPLYAVLHQTRGTIYKYLQQSGREEFFDLTADPHERQNLMSSIDQTIVTRLKERLTGVLASTEP